MYVLFFFYLSHRWLHHSWADTGIQKSWSRQCRCLHSDMDWTDNHQYLWGQTETEIIQILKQLIMLRFFWPFIRAEKVPQVL